MDQGTHGPGSNREERKGLVLVVFLCRWSVKACVGRSVVLKSYLMLRRKSSLTLSDGIPKP
jgi:hypothetical protein